MQHGQGVHTAWFNPWELGGAGWKITLEVSEPDCDHQFFSGVAAKDRIRIFLPTGEDGDTRYATAGDEAIIGPESATNSFEFFDTEDPNKHNIHIFKGYGKVKFGVEGIEFGSMVDISIKQTYYGYDRGSEDPVIRARLLQPAALPNSPFSRHGDKTRLENSSTTNLPGQTSMLQDIKWSLTLEPYRTGLLVT